MYKYALGRIRSLESNMLDQNKFFRMAEAKDLQAAFHILNETSYASLLNLDFRTMLDLARQELKTFCEQLFPDNYIIKAVWAKYDFENIKIILKAHDDNCPLYKCGNIDPELLKRFILKDEDTLPAYYRQLINNAKKIKNTLKLFDFIDQTYQEYKNKLIPSIPNNAKYFADGIEPILVFLKSKEEEIAKIGFILECKKNQISIDRIKEKI